MANSYEQNVNFSDSHVATAPSPATSGTSLTVTAGEGTLFDTPTGSGSGLGFNAIVCPANSQPTAANAEIVRCTAKSTDTFTMLRAREGTSARTIIVGDRFFVGPTAATFEAIGAIQTLALAQKRNDANTVTTYLTLPIFEDNTTQTVSPFGNDVPGINLTATGVSIVHANLVVPADVVANNFKLRVVLGSASAGNIRLEHNYLKLADGGTATTALSSGTGQTVTLAANTLKIVDLVAGTTPGTAGNLLNVRVFRSGDDGADTLAATAYLISAALVYDATI